MKTFRWIWPSLSQKERFWILIFWGVLLVYAFFHWIFFPAAKLFKAYREELQLKHTLVVDHAKHEIHLKLKLELLDKLQNMAKKEQGQMLRGVILKREIYTSFLSDWVRLAQANHVQVLSLKVEEAKDADLSKLNLDTKGLPLQELPVKVVFQGEYTPLLKFLAMLEEKSRMPKVDQFILGIGDAYPRLRGEMSMRLYVQSI